MAADKPRSLTKNAKLDTIITIPIKPKSSGDSNLAKMAVTAKFKTVIIAAEEPDHATPLSVFWVKVTEVFGRCSSRMPIENQPETT